MDQMGRLVPISLVFLIFLVMPGNCLATGQESVISFTGQVTWQDIEGGFYGIITPDGTKYLPQNLPAGYQTDGVTVDITGILVPDVVTMQMWGEPIEIKTISPVNAENPYIQPWYSPDSTRPVFVNETHSEHLVMAASGLQAGLNEIDARVSAIAQNLTLNGIEGENLKRVLLQGLDNPGVLEVSYIDKSGRLIAIVPEMYDSFEGGDVSGQELTSRLLSYPIPGMSEYITTIEGTNAVIIDYPVFSHDKKVAGYVSTLIDPVNLAERYAIPFLNETSYDLMVAEPDGTILYDAHPDMNGQEMWDNPIFAEFPDLQSWAAHYQNANAGIDQYTYYKGDSEELAKTDVIWTTVSLHGTPWRVFILHR